MEITEIDSRRRIIEFVMLPPPSSDRVSRRDSMSIASSPPTERSTELEQAALTFASGLGCETRQVSRHENDADASAFYARIFRMTEGWFRQVEELRSPSS
jgi:hypothetical protein